MRASAFLLVLWMALAPAADAEEDGAIRWIDPERTLSLARTWRFHAGDDLAWARPEHDDRGWRDIRLPAGSGRRDVRAEIAWYRLEVAVGAPGRRPSPEERSDWRLGVTVGKVDSAYELYAGGIRLGGVGTLPPAPRMDYDRHRVWAVPARAVDADGRLVLALRVWKSPTTSGTVGGPTEGPLVLGRIEQLTRRELLSELPALFLAGIYLLAGLFHLELFRRRRALPGYLWFAAVALEFALYSFLRTQWKYALGDHFLLFKHAEHVLLYLMLPSFVQLLWPLLGVRIGRVLRSFQGLSLAAGLAVAVSPGIGVAQLLLPFWQLGVVAVVAAGLWALFREAWRNHPEARIVAVGATLAAAAFLNDVAVDRGLFVAPRLAAYGFAVLVLSLAASLANQFLRIHRELEELRRELEQRVDERTRELFEASQAKSRFLATMSHEIRTPLNGIIGATDLLLATRLDREQLEYAEMAHKSGDALLALVDDILDFSKIEAGKVDLELRTFRLRECLEQTLDILASQAAVKGLDLAYLADRDVPEVVVADAMRLRQILVNLVGNAVKFTDRGGVLVEVSSPERKTESVAEICFRVIDTGIGIPSEHRSRLFEVFSQIDSSDARRHGGSGLGLAISRHLCELMGGEMGVESEPGRGSTFYFTIRAAVREATMEASLFPHDPDLEGRRVLVLEPGTVTQQVLVDHLEWWGMTPRVAADEEQARTWIRDGEPLDVAIVGLWGGDDSARLAEEIQRSRGPRRLPLIALRRMRAIELPGDRPRPGARVVRLTAPLKPWELFEALTSVLQEIDEPLPAGPLPAGPLPAGPLPVAASPVAASRSSPATPVGGGRPLAVLLAEDDEINRKVALRMLEQLGYRADVATNGLEALAALDRRPYDVVLLDVQMPELDGLETARRIRERWPRGSGPWLVAVTANALQGDSESCIAAGMDDYLAKPIRRRELIALFERADPLAQTPASPVPVPPVPNPPAPTPPGQKSPILDREALESLRRLDDGDGEFLRTAIDVFLRDAARKLADLEATLAGGDAAAVELLAHSLKSSARQLGGRRLASWCQKLERIAHDRPTVGTPGDGTHVVLQRLDSELAQLREELEAQRPAAAGE